jgi:hypothetical protein
MACAVKVLDLHVVKNRFGPTGTVRLYSLRTEARYTEDDPGYIPLSSLVLPSILRDQGQLRDDREKVTL